MLTKLLTGAQRWGPERVERVHHVRLLGIETGQFLPAVFRHFPTKAALLEAVLTRRFDRLRQQAEALLGADDPGQAFFGFFRYLVADAPAKIGIAEALLDAGGHDGQAAQASAGLRRAFGALLQRAQRAGAIRGDVELPDVYALLVSASQAAARQRLSEAVRARMLTIVFDGLAPRPAAQPARGVVAAESQASQARGGRG